MESYVIPTKKEFLPRTQRRSLVSLQKKEEDERYKKHYEAAIMRKDGYTIGEIADELRIHPGTVMNWLNRMIERGPGADYKVRQGRPPKFTPKQLKQLERHMRKSPRHFDLDSDFWTSRVVTEFVKTEFDVDITPGSMRRIMTRTKMRWPGSAAAAEAHRRGVPY